MLLMMSMMTLTSLMFMITSHPLFLVIILIFQTILTMSTLFYLTNMSWMMMVLFLIFLGGLLVIFSYLSALVPNESEKLQFIWMSMIFSPLLTYYFVPQPFQSMSPSTSIKKMNLMSDHSFFMFLLLYLLMALMVTMMTAQQLKTPLHQETY